MVSCCSLALSFLYLRCSSLILGCSACMACCGPVLLEGERHEDEPYDDREADDGQTPVADHVVDRGSSTLRIRSTSGRRSARAGWPRSGEEVHRQACLRRDGVEAAVAEGVAAQHAPRGQDRAPQHAVHADAPRWRSWSTWGSSGSARRAAARARSGTPDDAMASLPMGLRGRRAEQAAGPRARRPRARPGRGALVGALEQLDQLWTGDQHVVVLRREASSQARKASRKHSFDAVAHHGATEPLRHRQAETRHLVARIGRSLEVVQARESGTPSNSLAVDALEVART